GEMLQRPVARVFLQHHHPRLTSGPQEQPGPSFIAQAHLQTEDLPVEGLRPGEVLHPDRYLVDTADGKHRSILLPAGMRKAGPRRTSASGAYCTAAGGAEPEADSMSGTATASWSTKNAVHPRPAA